MQEENILQLHEITVPGFKEDYLYYLQLVNNTIGSIMYQYFDRRRSSKSKKRKKAKITVVSQERIQKKQILYEAINNISEQRKRNELKEQWKLKRIDFYNKDFIDLVNSLSEENKKAILENIKERRFASFSNWQEYYTAWDELRKARNILVHPKPSRIFNISLIVKTISRFLIPELCKQFINEIYSTIKKINPGKENITIRSDLMKPFNQIRNDVNEEKISIKRILNSLRLKGELSRGERKQKEQKKADLIKQVDRYFGSNEKRLRPYTFLQHYHFIGKNNFNIIHRMLESKQYNFNDIKDLFLLSTRINFILNVYFHKLKTTFKKMIQDNKEDNFGRIIKKTSLYQSKKDLMESLINLRNNNEHNRLVFTYIDNSGQEIPFIKIIQIMLTATEKFISKDERNNLRDKVRGLLEKEKFCWVYKDNKRDKVRHWTQDINKKSFDFVDERENVKHIVGKMVKDLQEIEKKN